MFESDLDILQFKIGQFFQDLFGIQTGSEEVQKIDNAYSHSANAWTPTALFGIDGYSFDRIRPNTLLKLRIDLKGSILS